MYIGNDLQVAESGNKIIDDISSSFNGSTTSFALTVGGYAPVPFPINTQQIYISVNGVLQEPDPSGSAGFKLLGTNIVFSSAPASGHAFFGVILSGADYVTVGTEFPSGSATAPSITFGPDNNTGLYSVTSGTMGFTSDGVQTFTLDGDGFNLPDGKKLQLGSSDDLQLHHTSGANYITSSTGNIYLDTQLNSGQIRFTSNNVNENMIVAQRDAQVELYYNGTKRLETSNTGTNVIGIHVDDGATHDGDVTFTGASANVVWDKSDNALEFTDSSKSIFGTGGDLEIYHSGSHSFIDHGGTGHLIINGSASNNVDIMKDGHSEYMARFKPDSSVDLYYDNVKRFETTSAGISIMGTIEASGNLDLPDWGQLKLGTADDILIYHTGTDSYFKNTTNDLYIQNTGDDTYIIATDDIYLKNGDDWAIKCIGDGATELYHDNFKSFETHANGITVIGPEGGGGILRLYGDEGDDNADKWDLNANTDGTLLVRSYTSGSWVTKLRVKATGEIQIPNDTGKYECGSSGDLAIFHDGSNSRIKNSTGSLWLQSDTGIRFTDTDVNESMAAFYDNGAVELYYDGTKRFETTSEGISISSGTPATLKISDTSGSGYEGYIQMRGNDMEIRGSSGQMEFYTGSEDGASSTERMRISSSGIVTVGNDSSGAASWGGQMVIGTTSGGILRVGDTGSGEKLYLEGGSGVGRVGTESNHQLNFITNGTSNTRMAINTSGNVLIGDYTDTAPDGFSSLLQINSANHTGGICIGRHTANANGPILIFQKSRSGSATPGSGSVSEDDSLGVIRWFGSDGTDRNSSAAQIACHVDDTPGDNDLPGRIGFFTTLDGNSSSTEHLRITSHGTLIGTGGGSTNYTNYDAETASMPKWVQGDGTNNKAADAWTTVLNVGTSHPTWDLFSVKGSYNFGLWCEVTCYFSQITSGVFGRQKVYYRIQRNGDASFGTTVYDPYDKIGNNNDKFIPTISTSGSGSSQRATFSIQGTGLTNYCQCVFHIRWVAGDNCVEPIFNY